ncbi:DUF2062 domain-containing protein [Octadecabacter sp. 1_MG-2023]|uniref:DUF2062 domain-containing protein n=1 Tax=unclassified Octadecabacter TaxID=196158 RepID=UPI001C09E671|nr:DUF2062 domain-containing protein [Octadecabacter sp. 1_MG-2023]MBU2992605.1 DUF2062 domain-containing protein [Octadecabacter sp. B2R22]MDO6734638.1 DUF2062 domain-containing protein [Octadecabacter sp. 1_MG-2023]
MVFRRRDRRSFWRATLELLWPRGGWGRAAQYVKHRVRRLPDTPEKISRGIWAGVFTTFSPFYGIHFFIAAFIAMAMRGNILASLMATFFGNPLTYIPIAYASLSTGHWLLGTRMKRDLLEGAPGHEVCRIGCQFNNAFSDLWHNFTALFTHQEMDWRGLSEFYGEVFYPYFVGGIIPGIITATIAYYISVPVIRAYQNRRRKRLRAKLAHLKNPADGA